MSEAPVVSPRGMRGLTLSVLFAVVCYFAFSLWGGWDEVRTSLLQVSMVDLLLLLFLSLVNYLLRFVRWRKFLRLQGYAVPDLANLRIYFSGFALTTTPGKAGEALRSLLLKPFGVSYPHSLAVLLAERLGDLMSVLLLACIGLYGYEPARPVVAVMAVIFIFGVWLLQQDALLGRIEQWLMQRLKQRVAHLISGFIDTLRHSGGLLSLPLLGYSLWLGIIAWGAEGLAFYYLLQVMGSDIGLVVALFIYAFSMLIGAISFLPGGLGGAEVTMTALLMLNGMDNGAAVAATLLIRLTTLWFAVVLGLLAMLPGRRALPTGT
ncbi:MAG: lysylphosphatidylglycerol synthase transmembrane domain-containing protein [Pseudomonadota bacterium]